MSSSFFQHLIIVLGACNSNDTSSEMSSNLFFIKKNKQIYHGAFNIILNDIFIYFFKDKVKLCIKESAHNNYEYMLVNQWINNKS